MKLYAYICGESQGNPGPTGIGVVIKDPCGEVLATVSQYLGIMMEEIAEYRALIAALEVAHALDLKRIKIYTDSSLLRGQVACHDPLLTQRMVPLHRLARRLLKGFEACDLICIPPEKNLEARQLARMGIENCKVIQFPVERLGQAEG